jgi:hypothetical protein
MGPWRVRWVAPTLPSAGAPVRLPPNSSTANPLLHMRWRWLGPSAGKHCPRLGTGLVVFVRAPEASGARPRPAPEPPLMGDNRPATVRPRLHAAPRVGVADAWCPATCATTLRVAFGRALRPPLSRAEPATSFSGNRPLLSLSWGDEAHGLASRKRRAFPRKAWMGPVPSRVALPERRAVLEYKTGVSSNRNSRFFVARTRSRPREWG